MLQPLPLYSLSYRPIRRLPVRRLGRLLLLYLLPLTLFFARQIARRLFLPSFAASRYARRQG